jgi:phospholipase C
MKRVAQTLFLFLGLGSVLAYPQGNQVPPKFKHVIVVFQENRTPDNLFQGLLSWPGIDPKKYDIQPSGMVAGTCKNPQASSINGGSWDPTTCSITGGTEDKRCLEPQPLAGGYDPSHRHCAFLTMYDKGKMDGAGFVKDNCHKAKDCTNGGAGEFLSYKFVPNIQHRLDPYLEIAAEYGWANRMFQTNQGPSFPAHQYLFGGTSAQNSEDDKKAVFIAENPGGIMIARHAYPGCLSPPQESNQVISPQPAGEQCPAGCTCYSNGSKECKITQDTEHNLCFDHPTLATLLDQHQLGWKYYAPSQGSIWNAPHSIKDVCRPDYTTGKCTGADYKNVDFDLSHVVQDINDSSCKLAAVSWVIPDGQCSDHAASSRGGGPAWVASIVNAVGKSTCNYWKDTAIIITWDDWGGWYDHVTPPVLPGIQGDYQLGFRVPLLVVSAYTKPGTVSDRDRDFGSILRFIEENFSLGVGSLGFADARANHGLNDFFNQRAGDFRMIQAPPVPAFCTMAPGQGVAPDDDAEEGTADSPSDSNAPQPPPQRKVRRQRQQQPTGN